jgi:hypothetical protein
MPGDDRVWRQIMRHAAMKTPEARESHVKVGVLASKGGKADHDGITMIELAAIHEFGSPAAGVPERSFIRRTFKEKERELSRVCAALARDYITGKVSLERALNQLGAWGAAEVKKTVTVGDGVPPPNADSTKRRKGSDRPLVDTGRMIDSVTWQVWMGRARDARGRFAK